MRFREKGGLLQWRYLEHHQRQTAASASKAGPLGQYSGNRGENPQPFQGSGDARAPSARTAARISTRAKEAGALGTTALSGGVDRVSATSNRWLQWPTSSLPISTMAGCSMPRDMGRSRLILFRIARKYCHGNIAGSCRITVRTRRTPIPSGHRRQNMGRPSS